MSIQMSADFEDLDKLEKRFRDAPDKFNEAMKEFLNGGVLIVERRVKELTPVNTGTLRSSIGHEIRGNGAEMQGIVGTAQKYAPFVELDTKPHWPPFRPISFWVKRKLGVSGQALYAVTRGVQRKIARRGTKGAHMFERAFNETQDEIKNLWDEVWQRAIDRL